MYCPACMSLSVCWCVFVHLCMNGHTAEICSCHSSKKDSENTQPVTIYLWVIRHLRSHLDYKKQNNNQTRLTSRRLKVSLYVLVLARSLYVCVTSSSCPASLFLDIRASFSAFWFWPHLAPTLASCLREIKSGLLTLV